MKKNVAIVILIIIILGLGGYLAYDKVLNKDTKGSETKEEVKQEEKKETKAFSLENVLNTKNQVYFMNVNGSYYSASLHDGEYHLNISQSMFEDLKHNLGLIQNPPTDVKLEGVPSNVVDMYAGFAGQAMGGEMLLFLTSDGSVYYLGLQNALLNNDFTVKGPIKGVEKVSKFIFSSTGPKEEGQGSGYMTTLAVREDGTFYDLGATDEILHMNKH